MSLSLLSKEQIERIHAASLEILETIGINIQHEQARKLLRERGCTLKEGRAYIPQTVVEDVLKQCPKSFTVYNRDASVSYKMEIGSLIFQNASQIPFFIDLETHQRREAHLQDLIDASRVLDALPNYDFISPLVTPKDVTPRVAQIAMYATAMKNSSKLVKGPGVSSGPEVRYIARLVELLSGGTKESREKPRVIYNYSPTSPLIYPDEVVDVIFEIAGRGLPTGPMPVPMFGASAPITMAGGIALANAEVLACMVLTSLIDPSTPVIYQARLGPFDMRTGNSIWGGPEVAVGCGGLVQMATYYGLPSNTYGISTSSKTFDEQVGYEKMMNGLTPVLAGATMMTSAGMIEDGLTASLAQLVVDNEIYGMITRVKNGVTVDDNALAIGALRDLVDKNQTTFLLSKHTRQNMRTTLYLPSVSNTQSRIDWEARGAKSVIQVAEERVRDILANHTPMPMDTKLVQAIDEMVAAAEAELTRGA